MRRSWSLVGFTVPAVLALGVLVLAGRTPVAANDGTDCEAARCAAQAAIDAACPCEDASNHGRYVRCVIRAAKENVPKECRGAVVRCAARSTCGRDDDAVICRPSAGTCEHPGKDCTANTRAHVHPSAAECEASGGTVEEGPSVCPPCPSETIQCCVQSSAMGAFDTCTLVDSATCEQEGGIAAGSGTCDPNPCPPSVATTTTTLATTSTTAATSSSTTQTTATTLGSTSTTGVTTTSTTTTSSTTNTTFSIVGAFLDGLT